jgi:hypothetical protein
MASRAAATWDRFHGTLGRSGGRCRTGVPSGTDAMDTTTYQVLSSRRLRSRRDVLRHSSTRDSRFVSSQSMALPAGSGSVANGGRRLLSLQSTSGSSRPVALRTSLTIRNSAYPPLARVTFRSITTG